MSEELKQEVVTESVEAAAEAATESAPEAANEAPAPEQSKSRRFADLGKRLASGVIYIVLMIGTMLWGNIPSVIMLSVASGICANEFYIMSRKNGRLPADGLGIVAAVLYAPVAYWQHLGGMTVLTLMLMLGLLLWYVLSEQVSISDVCISFFGAVYTGMLLGSVMLIRPQLPEPWGGVVVLVIFASVWINDSFAYLVGSRFGKHKMAPKISPKKSWEGFAGGLVGSVLVWLLLLLVPGARIVWWQALLFGVICGLMSVVGDLAESRIKRNYGVKDSGTLMPGHGGLLDRMDSLFLATATAVVLLFVSRALTTLL